MDDPLQIRIEPTADPDAVKITLNRQFEGLGQSFRSAQEADLNPLAKAILSIRGVREVFLLGDFITVRKQFHASWQALGPAIQAKLFRLLK
ncbi:MAG: NifU N-terminal domain-containing protein [Phycisphaerae bacterium]|nr:NifU N-terminal domain-containing protein [Phycisphaerae bacterium]